MVVSALLQVYGGFGTTRVCQECISFIIAVVEGLSFCPNNYDRYSHESLGGCFQQHLTLTFMEV